MALLTAVSLHENDNKNFQLALLFQQLKSKMHQRSFEEIKVNTRGGYCRQPMPKPLSHTLPSSKGLTKAEQAYVEQSLFVHYPGPMRTPAMNRVLQGTLALGWPLPGKAPYTLCAVRVLLVTLDMLILNV
jgi:hypothetical protein